MAKLPWPPPPDELADRARLRDDDVVAVHTRTVLWRVHRTVGVTVVQWNRLRHYGPVATARFDPHQPPPREQAEGVVYLACDVRTCVAEVFQQTRLVDRHSGAPYLTGFRLRRTVRLLDLSGTWPTYAGASQAISSGRRDVARAWARAIRTAFPALDGVWYPSSMNAGEPALALWSPAQLALPLRPVVSLPLSHPALAAALAVQARELGYLLL